ncbi:MAG: hypothetical protein ACJ79C_11755 [Myxococcales bacterium]
MGMRCGAGNLLCTRLPDRYYLVLVLAPSAQAARAAFVLRRAADKLAREL